jgi:peroxiredoxin Q/BCP
MQFMPANYSGEPRIGELAPALSVELEDQDGRKTRLEQARGRNVILYFYPRDGTPGCTVEGREFADLEEQFRAHGCELFGVSTDSVASHREFASKLGLTFRLLSDPGGDLARAFAVWRDGRVARATFVLDRELRVRRMFREVSPRGHARQVLDFVQSMLESHRMLGG